MRRMLLSLLALAFGLTVSGGEPASPSPRMKARPDAGKKMEKSPKTEGKNEKLRPQFTIGKATTRITGPLDDEGYMDYATALNERLRKGVTPDTNAFVLICKATGPRPEGRELSAEFYKWLGITAPPAKGDYFISQSHYAKDQLKIEKSEDVQAFSEEIDRARQRPWKAKQYPRVAGWLQANAKPLAVLHEATKRPQYYSPLVPARTEKGSSGLFTALLPHVQKCREMAQALTVRAMLHVGEGRFDDAWQDLIAGHRLGRFVAHGATLIEMLVGIAIDFIVSAADVAYLEHAPLDAKALRERLRELQQLPPMQTPADKVDLCERFGYLEALLMIDRYGPAYLQGLAGSRPSEPNALMKIAMKGIDWDPALALGNQWFDRMVTAMRIKDRAQREKQLLQIEKDLRALVAKTRNVESLEKFLIPFTLTPQKVGEQIGQITISLVIPAVFKIQQASDRSGQVQSNLHVAFALACYRREHGRYPETLDALAPAYLKQVPHDTFSGEELIYLPSEKGFLLYSVGVNGRDDEGMGYGEGNGTDDLNIRIPQPPSPQK